ncbi:MBL fold metallo-hydrolase [Vibrio sp.]|nr:MBL fold metallo-hydrolase [Vibrio sp.]
MALQYFTLPVTAFAQNCSIVWCDETMEGVIVDPGGDVKKLIGKVNELGVQLIKIILTHGHLDHVGGTVELSDTLFDLPIHGPHEEDNFWLQALESQSQMFGFPPTTNFQPDEWFNDGDRIRFGQQELSVIHTPGHTPGHVVFYSEETKLAFVGDVLFSGSIGRTDFPKGNFEVLIDSIKSKLWPLGDDVRFVPGHGEESTFGHERQHNPFVGDGLNRFHR